MNVSMLAHIVLACLWTAHPYASYHEGSLFGHTHCWFQRLGERGISHYMWSARHTYLLALFLCQYGKWWHPCCASCLTYRNLSGIWSALSLLFWFFDFRNCGSMTSWSRPWMLVSCPFTIWNAIVLATTCHSVHVNALIEFVRGCTGVLACFLVMQVKSSMNLMKWWSIFRPRSSLMLAPIPTTLQASKEHHHGQ